MRIIEGIKIAYWFVRRPNVFEAYIRLYMAKKEYIRKKRAKVKYMKEQREYNIATAQFNAERSSPNETDNDL